MLPSPIDNHISSSLDTGIHLATSTATTVAANALGSYIGNAFWTWMSKRSALKEEDLKRYHALTNAYRKMEIDIPKFWKLDKENRPSFVLIYQPEIEKLYRRISKLQKNRSGLHLAQASMLALMARYLESISKRNWYGDVVKGASIRPDGIEAMFMADMVIWFQDELPILSEENARIEFEKRISYCREISTYVSRNNDHDTSRANFKDLTLRLTEQMQNYVNFLIQRQEKARFNELINELSNDLSELAAYLFSSLYLMIRDVHQPFLIVEQFLKPYSSDMKVEQVKNRKLGEWLIRTLTYAGIRDSSYECNTVLKLQDIEHHLAGEVPEDTPCVLKGTLRHNPRAAEWGQWDFVTKLSKNSIKKIRKNLNPFRESHHDTLNYLRQIRELHRYILLFYFVRQNLVRSATVANFFGEDWIYGDPVGQAVLTELLAGVVDVVQDFHHDFETFWDNYFEKDFKPYAREFQEDDATYPCFNYLNRIDLEHKKNIAETINHIKLKTNAIREQALKLPSMLEKVKQAKKDLFSDLLNFLTSRKKTESPNYEIIKEALAKFDEKNCVKSESGSTFFKTQPKTKTQQKSRVVTTKYNNFFVKENLPEHKNGNFDVENKTDELMEKQLPAPEQHVADDFSNTHVNIIEETRLFRKNVQSKNDLFNQQCEQFERHFKK